MGSRFPLSEAPQGDEAKKTIEKALATMHGGAPPFTWVEEDGSALLGCYGPLSYSSELTTHFFEMAKVVYKPGTVKPRNRELVILGLVSIIHAPYAVYCHRRVGHKVDLTDEQISDAMAGKVPQGLNEEENLSYRLGRELTTLNGPLSEKLWKEVTSKLSKEEFVGIAHTVAGYKWVTLLENCGGDSRTWD